MKTQQLKKINERKQYYLENKNICDELKEKLKYLLDEDYNERFKVMKDLK